MFFRRPRRPEEFIHPRTQMIRFVEVGQQAGENAHAVERFAGNRLVGVGVDIFGLELSEARDDGVDEGFEVLGGRGLGLREGGCAAAVARGAVVGAAGSSWSCEVAEIGG